MPSYILQGNPYYTWVSIQAIPCATFAPFAKSYPKYSIWVCNYILHILAIAYYRPLPTSLRESSKPVKQIQMLWIEAGTLCLELWIAQFCLEVYQAYSTPSVANHHVFITRVWRLPPFLNRKNYTLKLHETSSLFERNKGRHAEDGSLAAGSKSGTRAGATATAAP